MLLCDLIRITVLLVAAVATALVVVTIAAISGENNVPVLVLSAVWWPGAAMIGMVLGRYERTYANVAAALARAKPASVFPTAGPWRIVLARLWPIAAFTVVVAALAWLFPQVASMSAGFAILTALAWRRAEAAVTAIEQRDGVRFHVDVSAAWQPLKVFRTPGFMRL